MISKIREQNIFSRLTTSSPALKYPTQTAILRLIYARNSSYDPCINHARVVTPSETVTSHKGLYVCNFAG